MTEQDFPRETIAGRYRLLSPIGAGGMSSVFVAERLGEGGRVALKLLSRELMSNPAAVERFAREVQVASRLRHPNVVGVLDHGKTAAGQPFLVMELLEGIDLRSLVKIEGPVPLERLAPIVDQVCAAIEYTHAEGVIHRDLKSANIMLVLEGDGAEVAKVVDFGISKGVDAAPSLTQAGTVIGTPEYMSPEQVAGRRLDSPSDVYSLGIVLFEALTGGVPFTGSTGEILAAHTTRPAPSLRERNGSIPPAVEAVVQRALVKDPARRYPTALALAEAFARACAGDEGVGLAESSSPGEGSSRTAAWFAPQQVPAVGRPTRDGARPAGRTEVFTGAATVLERPPRPRRRYSPSRAALLFGATTIAISMALVGVLWQRATSNPVASKLEQGIRQAAHLLRSGRRARARQLLDGLPDLPAACMRVALYRALGALERAVTDAERCVDTNPKRKQDSALARVVVAALGSGERTRAFRLLVEEMPKAARGPLLDAASDPNSLVRAGAYKAAQKLGYAKDFDRVARLLLDLEAARGCEARRRLALDLATLMDRRVLAPLERELSRPARQIACFGPALHEAVRKLRRSFAPVP